MADFFINNWDKILLTIITGLIGFSTKKIYSEFNRYKKYMEKEEEQKIEYNIEEHLEPLQREFKKLSKKLEEHIEENKVTSNLLLNSYRFRLVQLCKIYLSQGYMTEEQYEQLSEFYKLYHSLGGNSQGTEYYEKTIKLPIKHEVE